MIDVTPGELPSSITGQREGALALLADQRDLGGPFRDFRCFEGVGGIEKGCRHHVVTMSSPMSSPVFSLKINNLWSLWHL
jgi:hypothetical protein